MTPETIARMREEISELVVATEQLATSIDLARRVLEQHAKKIAELQLEIGALKFSRAIDEGGQG